MLPRVRLVVLVASSSFIVACTSTQTPETKPAPDPRQLLMQQAKTSKTIDLVRSLSDDVGPRPAGSEAFAKAAAWGLVHMRDAGLSNVHLEDAKVKPWIRLSERGDVVAPTKQHLSLTMLGGSISTPEGGLEGEVIEAESLEALSALPDDAVRGKIAFVGVVTKATKDGSGYGKAVPARGKGASIASKKGAIAYLVRSIATTETRLPHTGSMHYDPDAPKIPAAALAVPDAEMLHRLIAGGAHLRVKLDLQSKEGDEVADANVLGDVVGRERPDEVVLLGAHLDSWDLGTGALDDGAGVAIVMESARLIQSLPTKPRRTVRVVLFANEEHGLDGGFAYARAHESELPRHVIALECDLGAGKVFRTEFLGGSEMGRALDPLLAPLTALGVHGTKEGEFFGADIAPLRFAGVPQIELHQDATHYFDHHHSADDTPDKIDPKSLNQAVAAVAAFAFGAADSNVDFGRVPSEKRGKKWW